MEENNNMDTPQPQTANTTGMDPFGAPVESNEGSTQENLSVEDAFFSKVESEEQSAPETGQPAETQETPIDNKNDDKRYEYWQSQAAKKDNELRQFKAEVQQALAVQQQQAQTAPQNKSQDEFPPPPLKPEKPRGFSREEAWTDPNSESARYLDEVESYNDNLNQYRDLRSQYDVALLREQMQKQEQQRQVAISEQRQRMAVNQQKQGVYEHVQGHYGLSPEDAKDFVQSMSDPGSLNLDNLVDLYRLKKGQGEVNTQSQGPSEAFQQSRNAQQVPSPMGVMPGQSNQPRNDADTIMDELINTHNSKNPWS
jgi:hypothetical protein